MMLWRWPYLPQPRKRSGGPVLPEEDDHREASRRRCCAVSKFIVGLRKDVDRSW